MATSSSFLYSAYLIRLLDGRSSKLRRVGRRTQFKFGLWVRLISRRRPLSDFLLRHAVPRRNPSHSAIALLLSTSDRCGLSTCRWLTSLRSVNLMFSYSQSPGTLPLKTLLFVVQPPPPAGFSCLDRSRSNSPEAATKGGGLVVYHTGLSFAMCRQHSKLLPSPSSLN